MLFRSTIPGIGKKTAERIVVELKDKFENQQVVYAPQDIREEVVGALVNLGYKVPESRKAVEKCSPNDDFETVLKNALQFLSGKK